MPFNDPNSTSEERLRYLTEHLIDRDSMKEVMALAVAEGVKAVVADPDFWAGAAAAMQQRAQSMAGGWLFAGLRHALSKFWLMALLIVGMWLAGGLPGLWAAIKVIVGGHAQ